MSITKTKTVEQQVAKAVEAHSGQFLTFLLAGEEYGVDILKVQEIRGWSAVTRIPKTPAYVQGVLNLRGTIVPLIDLRMRFGLPRIDYTATTVIVILSVAKERDRHTIGIVVDGVSDVLSVGAEEIKPAPSFGDSIRTEFINGLVTVEDRMVILLDSDKLLTQGELTALDAIR